MNKCMCCIIPADVLERLANDETVSDDMRKSAANSAQVSRSFRTARQHNSAVALATKNTDIAPKQTTCCAPSVAVFNCNNTLSLPGVPVPDSNQSGNTASINRIFEVSAAVAAFYQEVFGRNSIDDSGLSLISSVHYGANYSNALWTGIQMVYGDGDGEVFIDFTQSNDVIAHELTHGVTQYTLQLDYTGDAGGLNESMSDCFGSMFRQWSAKQDVNCADWLIGADIMGPATKAKGINCLRNMLVPDSARALARQPTHYSQLTPEMDPHYTSGPPNLAFATACVELGGYSWEVIGQIWYAVLAHSGSAPGMKMPEFAARTRQIAMQKFAGRPEVITAVNNGWEKAGL